MTQVPAKLPKNMFKCFKCRLTFDKRDGDWHVWDSMQVHLCRGCNRVTRGTPERAHDPLDPTRTP